MYAGGVPVKISARAPIILTEIYRDFYQGFLLFRGPCIVIYSYNESKRDALFLKFISQSTPHVSSRSTAHHQEYLNTVYTQ